MQATGHRAPPPGTGPLPAQLSPRVPGVGALRSPPVPPSLPAGTRGQGRERCARSWQAARSPVLVGHPPRIPSLSAWAGCPKPFGCWGRRRAALFAPTPFPGGGAGTPLSAGGQLCVASGCFGTIYGVGVGRRSQRRLGKVPAQPLAGESPRTASASQPWGAPTRPSPCRGGGCWGCRASCLPAPSLGACPLPHRPPLCCRKRSSSSRASSRRWRRSATSCGSTATAWRAG